MIADAGRYLLLSLLSSFRCIRDMNNKFWACEQCPARNGHTTAPAETTVGVWYQSVLLLIRTRSSWRPVVFVQVLYNKPRHLSSIPGTGMRHPHDSQGCHVVEETGFNRREQIAIYGPEKACAQIAVSFNIASMHCEISEAL